MRILGLTVLWLSIKKIKESFKEKQKSAPTSKNSRETACASRVHES